MDHLGYNGGDGQVFESPDVEPCAWDTPKPTRKGPNPAMDSALAERLSAAPFGYAGFGRMESDGIRGGAGIDTF